MSNILKVFNPPDPQGQPVSQENCVPCLLTSAAVMVAGGSYMATGAVFATKEGKPLPKAVTPRWKNTVRGVGGVVALLGVARGIEALMVSDSQSKQKKLE